MAIYFNAHTYLIHQLCTKQMDFNNDVLKLALTNVLQNGIVQYFNDGIGQAHEAPSSAFGYPSGGAVLPANMGSDGTVEVTTPIITFTASGGDIGPFRYVVMYNDNTNHVIGWYDYGNSITLYAGETFEISFYGNSIFNLT